VDRYSQVVGERILSFLESQFNSLYQIDFSGFLQVLTDFLNAGPESYRKFVFICMGLTNPGIICEHDLFTILEIFKEKDSFFFYKELINLKEVPRNFKSMTDKSDLTFFEAFSGDLKRISILLRLHKRMMGIQDDEDQPITEENDGELLHEIRYVLEKIGK